MAVQPWLVASGERFEEDQVALAVRRYLESKPELRCTYQHLAVFLLKEGYEGDAVSALARAFDLFPRLIGSGQRRG